MLDSIYRMLWSLLGYTYKYTNRNKLVYRIAMRVMDAWCNNDIRVINKRRSHKED